MQKRVGIAIVLVLLAIVIYAWYDDSLKKPDFEVVFFGRGPEYFTVIIQNTGRRDAYFVETEIDGLSLPLSIDVLRVGEQRDVYPRLLPEIEWPMIQELDEFEITITCEAGITRRFRANPLQPP